MLNTYSSCNSSYIDDLKVSNTDYDNVVVNHNNEQHLVWARDRSITVDREFASTGYYSNIREGFDVAEPFGIIKDGVISTEGYDNEGYPNTVPDYRIMINISGFFYYIFYGGMERVDYPVIFKPETLSKSFPQNKVLYVDINERYKFLNSNRIVMIPFSVKTRTPENNIITLHSEFPIVFLYSSEVGEYGIIGNNIDNDYKIDEEKQQQNKVTFLLSERKEIDWSVPIYKDGYNEDGYFIYRKNVGFEPRTTWCSWPGTYNTDKIYYTLYLDFDERNNLENEDIFQENYYISVGKLLRHSNPGVEFDTGDLFDFTYDMMPLYEALAPNMRIYDNQGFEMRSTYMDEYFNIHFTQVS